MDKVLNVLIIILFLVGTFTVIAMATPVREVPNNQNPYNPLIQPGRYSNYLLSHPNAEPMPRTVAERELV